MAEMICFLADGAAFAPGKVVQPGRPPSPLAPPALPETSGMRVTSIMRATAIEAIAQGMVPLLSFADFASRMSAPNGYFESAVTRDLETFAGTVPFFSVTFGRLPETLVAASAFIFFRNSTETGTERDP
jgi:hypothetical protein